MRYTCQQSEFINNIECHNMIQPLDSLFHDIIRDYNSISHLIPANSKRSAWFSAVGTIFKHIFGTLDEDDANKYNHAIQTLYNTNRNLSSNLARSIFVSNSAISTFNSSIIELNKNQFLLTDAMDKMSLIIKNVSDITNAVSFQNNLNQILNVLEATLLTLSYKVEDLVSSILFVKSNTIHPSVITPKQLYEDIIINFKNIPKHKEFPVELSLNNIHLLMNLVDLVAYYLDNKLVFVVKIPLVNLISYNLYKSVPIPVPHDANMPNSYALIITPKSYVGLSEDRKTYFSIDNLELCKTIINNHFVCNSLDILSVINNPNCEIEIMTKAVEVLPEKCTTKFIYGNIDIWHKLNGNKWIFVQSNHAKLTIECKHICVDKVISGTGILLLKPDCTAFCKDIKLDARENFNLTTSLVISNFNIVNDSCCNLKRFTELSLTKLAVPEINNVNLESLKLLNDLPNQFVEDTFLYDNTIPNTVSLSFSVIAFIVIISLMIYNVKVGICYKRKLVINPKQENISMNPSPVAQPRLRIE